MTIPAEKAARAAQIGILRDYFTAHPWQIVPHDVLRALAGENYRSRISELNREGLRVENVPQYKADGTRGYGAYRFRPEQLGRDASEPVGTTLFDMHQQPR